MAAHLEGHLSRPRRHEGSREAHRVGRAAAQLALEGRVARAGPAEHGDFLATVGRGRTDRQGKKGGASEQKRHAFHDLFPPIVGNWRRERERRGAGSVRNDRFLSCRYGIPSGNQRKWEALRAGLSALGLAHDRAVEDHHRQDAHEHDEEGRDGAVLEGRARGLGIDESG